MPSTAAEVHPALHGRCVFRVHERGIQEHRASTEPAEPCSGLVTEVHPALHGRCASRVHERDI